MITILTPTYNRANHLTRLHRSLCNQSDLDFLWLVIDDGSTDNTDQLISEFIKISSFKILYFKKENGGKHTAINYGLKQINSPYVLILDSDDWLANNAIEITKNYLSKIENENNICGIIGLSKYENGEVVGTVFPKDDWGVSFSDVYLKYNIKGDKSVCFKTEILKKYPFPENNEVKFVFEAVVWHEMAKKYNVLAINKSVQYKEYLIGGLTDSSYKINYIKGLAFSYFTLIKNNTHPFLQYPKEFIWNHIHLIINSLLSGKSYFKMLSFTNKMIYLVVFPRAYYTFVKLKNKVIHD